MTKKATLMNKSSLDYVIHLLFTSFCTCFDLSVFVISQQSSGIFSSSFFVLASLTASFSVNVNEEHSVIFDSQTCFSPPFTNSLCCTCTLPDTNNTNFLAWVSNHNNQLSINKLAIVLSSLEPFPSFHLMQI